MQELGSFVEDGFWMDAIKTHCYVTYPSSDIVSLFVLLTYHVTGFC